MLGTRLGNSGARGSSPFRLLAVLVPMLAAVAALLIAVPTLFAATALDTAADVTISADTAADGGNTFTALPSNSPAITLDVTVANGETVTLTAPTGWTFAAGTGTVTFAGGTCAGSVTSRTTATWVATLSADCDSGNTIVWDEITIKPTLGGTTATGDIDLAFSSTSAADLADVGTITITHGAATVLNVTTEPSSSTVAGVNFAQQSIVTVEDQFGNTVTSGSDSTQTITAAKTTGTGTLSGTLTEAAVSGVANFTGNGMSIELVGTDKVLTFSGDGAGSDDTSASFTITHAAASALNVTTEPSSTTAVGVAFATQPIVTVEDAFGNTVTTGADSTQTITAALTTGTGTLSGTLTEAAVSGVANFTGNGMSIELVGTDKVLTFSGDGNGTDDTSASFAITAAAPSVTGEVLTDLFAPTLLNLSTGQVIGISVSPRNELGDENLSMPNVVYTWNAGSCGTLDSTTSRTPVFTASSSACSGTITVHASQGGNPQVPSSDRSINVSVVAPPPPPAPTAVPTDPVVVPTIVPAGLSSGDVSVILPSSGGTFRVDTTETDPATGADLPPIAIEVPSGAIDSGTAVAVTINVITTDDVPGPPTAATEGASSGTFKFGSTIFEVQWYDDGGTALDTFKLNRPAKICVPFTLADIAGAAGGPDGLAIWRFNGSEWIELNSTVNISDGTVCARTLNFSFFALGLSVEAPDAVDTGLPATGGYSPGLPTLILVLVAGLALLATGVVSFRRTRGNQLVQ